MNLSRLCTRWQVSIPRPLPIRTSHILHHHCAAIAKMSLFLQTIMVPTSIAALPSVEARNRTWLPTHKPITHARKGAFALPVLHQVDLEHVDCMPFLRLLVVQHIVLTSFSVAVDDSRLWTRAKKILPSIVSETMQGVQAEVNCTAPTVVLRFGAADDIDNFEKIGPKGPIIFWDVEDMVCRDESHTPYRYVYRVG